MAIQIGSGASSELVNELKTIQGSEQWQYAPGTDRLSYLTWYEDELYKKAEDQYDGGWDKFVADNPQSLQYLEDLKKSQFAEAQSEIKQKYPDSVIGQLIDDKSKNPASEIWRHFAAGTRYAPSLALEAMGYEEEAKEWEKSGDQIRENWQVGVDRLGELVYSGEEPGTITRLAYNFARGALPFLQPEDEKLLEHIYETDGDKWYSPQYLAQSMGHFARLSTIMRAMPFDNVTGVGYQLKYAVAAGISEALALPQEQISAGRLLGTMGMTFAALHAGHRVSMLAKNSRLITGILAKIPARAAEFVEGRFADFGESIADSVIDMIRTKDPLHVLAVFPASLAANMLEEVLIDLPGISSGKVSHISNQMYGLRKSQAALNLKKEKLKNSLDGLTKEKREKAQKDIENISKVEKMYGEYYQKRAKKLSDVFRNSESDVSKAIKSDPQRYAQLRDASIENGMNEMEASEAAAVALIETQITEDAKREAVIDDMGISQKVRMNVNKLLYANKAPQSGTVAFQSLVNNLPKDVRNSVQLTETNEIEIDIKQFEKSRGKFEGQIATGETEIRDGKAYVKIKPAAPGSTGYHEFFHVAEKLGLEKKDISILEKSVGDVEKRADEFARWMKVRNEEGAIGRVFSKIKDFIDRLLQAGRFRGFRTVNDIFRDVSEGKIALATPHKAAVEKYYQSFIHKGFLTSEGNVHIAGTGKEDFPNAAKDNWVRKDVSYSNDITYKVMRFDGDTVPLIEKDLDNLTWEYADRAVTIDTPTNQWIISLDQYREKRDLRGAMRHAVHVVEKPENMTADKFYDVEPVDPIKEVEEQTLFSKLPKLIKDNKFIRSYIQKYTKDKKDMSWLASKLELPFFAAQNWPEIAEVIHVQEMREKLRSQMFYEFSQELKPYAELSGASYDRVNRVLVQGDDYGRTFTTEELKADGLSDAEITAYHAYRSVMDMVVDHEIDYIRSLQDFELTRDFLSNAKGDTEQAEKLEREAEIRANDFNERIEKLEELKGKGYLPHVWTGKHAVRFKFDKNDLKGKEQQILDAVAQVEKVQGRKNGELTKEIKAVIGDAYNRDPLDMLITFDSRGDSFDLEDALAAANISYETENIGKTDKNAFEDAKRSDAVDVISRLTAAISENDVEGRHKATLDLLDKEYEKLEKTQGWRQHFMTRKGVLGYQTTSIAEITNSYLSGYAGMASKREASSEFARVLANMDPKSQPKLYNYAKSMVKELTRNSDNIDKMINHVRSFIFAKYLGFNIPFHIRNRFQPWYMGVATLQAHGISPIKAADQIARAQKDLAFTELSFAKSTNRNEAEVFTESLRRLSEGELKAVGLMVSDGKLTALKDQIMDKVQDIERNNKVRNKLKRGYDAYISMVASYVGVSDGKNRVQTFLAAYRSLKNDSNLNEEGIDMDAYNEAVSIMEEANVVYKGWNTLPILMSDKTRWLKPAFTFQKYGWHMVRMQVKWMSEGKLGPMLQMMMITALLGGISSGVPFWEDIKKMSGAPLNMDVRKKLVESLGGDGALLRMMDTGLFGLAGIDMRMSLAVPPRSLSNYVDPLMGDNAIMGLWKDFFKTGDMLVKGKIAQAIFEGVAAPGALKKLSRSIREATTGKTTHRGDIVLDLSGKPLKLSGTELVYASLGLLPRRVGQHYVATNNLTELRRYYSSSKSDIATRWKIAKLRKDNEALRMLRREIADYNRELESYPTEPTSLVTDTTIKKWERGAGSQRIRDLAKYYYPQ